MLPVSNLVIAVALASAAFLLPTGSVRGEDSQPATEWPEVRFDQLHNTDLSAAFRPGEEFVFRVSWGPFSSAGEISLTTERGSGASSDAFLIRTRSVTRGLVRSFYPVDTSIETLLDADDWSLVSTRVQGRAGRDESASSSLIDHETRTYRHVDLVDHDRTTTQQLPYPHVLDWVSSLLHTRAWALSVGESYPVFAHGNGRFYLMSIIVTNHERLSTPLGSFSAYRLEARMDHQPRGIFAKGGSIAMWISDDDLRLPLRMEVKVPLGTALAQLERYRSPEMQLEAAPADRAGPAVTRPRRR
jgi:hypothetical protein